MLDRLDADRSNGEMRLARAGSADQDDVARLLQELAAMKLMGEVRVHLDLGRGMLPDELCACCAASGTKFEPSELP